MELYQLEVGILLHLLASYFGFCTLNIVHCDSQVAHTADHQASKTEQLLELNELPLPFINRQLDINANKDSHKEYYKDIWKIRNAPFVNKANTNTPFLNKPHKSKSFLISDVNIHSFLGEQQNQIKQDNAYHSWTAPNQYAALQVPAALLQNNYHVQNATKGNNSHSLHNKTAARESNILFDVLNNIGSYRKTELENLANNSSTISATKDVILENTPTKASFILHSIDNTKEIKGQHATTRSKRGAATTTQQMTIPLQKLDLEIKVKHTETSPRRIFKRYLRGLGNGNPDKMQKHGAKFILCSTGKHLTQMRLGTDHTSSEAIQYSEESYSSESAGSDFPATFIPSYVYKSSNRLAQSLTLNTLRDTSDIDSTKLIAPNYGYKLENRPYNSLKFKPLISYYNEVLDKDFESSEAEEWSEEEIDNFIDHNNMKTFDYLVTPKKAKLDKIVVLGSPVPVNNKLNTANYDRNVTPQSTKKLKALIKESKQITTPHLEDVGKRINVYQFENNEQTTNTNEQHSFYKSTLSGLSQIVGDQDCHKEHYASYETDNQALKPHIHTDMKLKADNLIYGTLPKIQQKVYYVNPISDTKVNDFADAENAVTDDYLFVTTFFPQMLPNYGILKTPKHKIASCHSAFTQTNHQQPRISYTQPQVKYEAISENNILDKVMENAKQKCGHFPKTNPSVTSTQQDICKIWKDFHEQAVDEPEVGNTKKFRDPHIVNLDTIGIDSLKEVITQHVTPSGHQVQVETEQQEHINDGSNVVSLESTHKKFKGDLFPIIWDFSTPCLPKTFHCEHQLDTSHSGSELKETMDVTVPNELFVLPIPHSNEVVEMEPKQCVDEKMPVEVPRKEIEPDVLLEKGAILSPTFCETQSSDPAEIALQEEQNMLKQSIPNDFTHLNIKLPKEFHRGQYLDVSHVGSETEAHKIPSEDLVFMSTPYSNEQGQFTNTHIISTNEQITGGVSSEKDIVSSAELRKGQDADVVGIESPNKIPWPYIGLAKQVYNGQYIGTTDSDLKQKEVTNTLIENYLPFLCVPISKDFICAHPMTSTDIHNKQQDTQKQIISVDIGEGIIYSSPEIIQRLHQEPAEQDIQQEQILKQDTLKMENCKLEDNNVHFADTDSKHDKQQILVHYVTEQPKPFIINIVNEPERTIPVNKHQEMEHHFQKPATSEGCQQMSHSSLNTKSTVSTTLQSGTNQETVILKKLPAHAYFQKIDISTIIHSDSNNNFKNKKQNIIGESAENGSGAVKKTFTADYIQQGGNQHLPGLTKDDLTQDDSVVLNENPSTKFLDMHVSQDSPSDIVLPVHYFSYELKYINEQSLSDNLHNVETIPSRITDVNHIAVKIPWTSVEVVKPFEMGSIGTEITEQPNNQELQATAYAAKCKDIDQTDRSLYMTEVPTHTTQSINHLNSVSQRLGHSYETSISTLPTTTPNDNSAIINDDITVTHIQDLSRSSELNKPEFDQWDLLKQHYKQSVSQPNREKKATCKSFTKNDKQTENHLENYVGRNVKISDTQMPIEASVINNSQNIPHSEIFYQPELINEKKLHVSKDVELSDGPVQTMFNELASKSRKDMGEEHSLLNPETVSITNKTTERDINDIQLNVQLEKPLHSQENNSTDLDATAPTHFVKLSGEYETTSTTPNANDVPISVMPMTLLKTASENEILITLNDEDHYQDLNSFQIPSSRTDTIHAPTDKNSSQDSYSLFLDAAPLEVNDLSVEQNKTIMSVASNISHNEAEHLQQKGKEFAPGFQHIITRQKRAAQQAKFSTRKNRNSHETVNTNLVSVLGRSDRSVQSSYSNEIDNASKEPNYASNQLIQNEVIEKNLMTDTGPIEKQYNDFGQGKTNEVQNILYDQFAHMKMANDIHAHATDLQKDYNENNVEKTLQQFQSQMKRQTKESEWNIHKTFETLLHPRTNNYDTFKSSMLQKSTEVTPLASKLIIERKNRPAIETNLDIVRNVICWLRECVADIDKLGYRSNYNVMQR